MFIGRTDAKAETLVLWPPDAKSWLIGKDPDAGRDWGQGQEEKGTTEDEMAGWHHWLDGCESEWTLGVGDAQGGLVCYGPWGGKKLDTTERLNWTKLNPTYNETGNQPADFHFSILLTRLGFFPAHLKVCDHSIQRLNAFSFFSWTPQWGSQDLRVLIAAKELKYKGWWFTSCNSFS